MGIRGKVVVLVVASVMVASGAVGAIAVRFNLKSLEQEILEHGRALTLALDSALRESLVLQDSVNVKKVVDSYGKMSGVVFAAALSPDGEVLASAPLAELPQWLKNRLSKITAEDTSSKVETMVVKTVSPVSSKEATYSSLYLVHKSVLEGAGGHVFLAFPTAFTAVVTSEKKLVTMVTLAALGITLLVAMVAAGIGAGLASRVLHLAEVAENMSLGELDTPVEKEGSDELARLAEALERMRVSLKAAIERIRKRSV